MKVPVELVTEQACKPARDLGNGFDVDARLDAVALELPDEILGGDVPGRIRRERAAAEPADRCVEHGRAAVERRPGRRVARVTRVVAVEPDRFAEDRDTLRQAADAARGRDSDRVGENELVGVEAFAEVGDNTGIDFALERAAECAGHRHRGRLLRAREHRLHALDRFLQRRVRVASVERVGCRKRAVEPVKRGRGKALVPALVQHEPAELGLAVIGGCDNLLRACHLGHELVAHERHGLDPRQSGRGEAGDEVSPYRGRQRHRLVLKPVARPDVADGYLHRH